MVEADLMAELQARGVMLTVQGGELLTISPKGAITAELAAQITAQKAELLQAFQLKSKSAALSPLPGPLVRLVLAAAGNHLNCPGFLGSGMVTNLGEYVLTSASLYAAGLEPERQLADLWAARKAWESS